MSKCNEGIKYRLRAVYNNLQLSIKQRAGIEIIFSPHFLQQRALSAFWGFLSHWFFFFSNQFELKLSDINAYSYCTEYILYNGLKKIIQRNISFKLLILFISLLKVKDTGILDSVTPQERKRQEVSVCMLT